MDSLNESIKRVLQFISDVQKACDNQRLLIEERYSTEYKNFLGEWKDKNEKIEKPTTKVKAETFCEDTATEDADLLSEELQELALAEALLEKSRKLRLKYKIKPETVPLDTRNSISPCGSNGQISYNTVPRSKPSTTLCPPKIKKTTSVPNNYSSVNCTKTRPSSSVSHPKSAGFSVNENGKHLRDQSENNPKTTRVCRFPIKKSENLSEFASVVSRKQLNEFKNIKIERNGSTRKNKSCENMKLSTNPISNNFCDMHIDQRKTPNHKMFLSYLKNGSTPKTSHLSSNIIWYPHLNQKNRNILLTVKCLTNKDYQRALRSIHQIQTILFWIDAFNLVGRLCLPNITSVDKKNKRIVQTCATLSSIYHKTFQRRLMLE